MLAKSWNIHRFSVHTPDTGLEALRDLCLYVLNLYRSLSKGFGLQFFSLSLPLVPILDYYTKFH